MPKKTKRQKKLAQSRRQNRQIFKPVKASINSSQIVKESIKPQSSTGNRANKKGIEFEIIADLKKTLILASLLFALEFLVFFAKLKGI